VCGRCSRHPAGGDLGLEVGQIVEPAGGLQLLLPRGQPPL